jgi:hypothetical protein
MVVVTRHRKNRNPGFSQTHNAIVEFFTLLKRRSQAIKDVSGNYDGISAFGDREISNAPPSALCREIEINLLIH